MKELTAREFFNMKNEITNNCGIDCKKCPFGKYNNGYFIDCHELDVKYPGKSLDIIIKYSLLKIFDGEHETTKITRKNILQTAEKCVCGDREQDYGSPEDNFKTIASLWEVYLKKKCVDSGSGISINPDDVAVMMILVKIARISSGHAKSDNWVDIAGYAACGGEVEHKNER